MRGLPARWLTALTCLLLGWVGSACDSQLARPDGGAASDGGETHVDEGPDPDWPPLLEHEPPSFVEVEGGGLGVPSLDGQTSLVVVDGALFLERITGERVRLLDSAVLARGEVRAELSLGGQPRLADRRAHFNRGLGVTEWYEPVVGGVEQGWTLASLTAEGEGRLELRLGVGPEVDATQTSDAFITLRTGFDAIEYSSLVATDAEGTVLPSSMTLVEDEIVLEVDDSDAVYPVTVDPLAVMSSYFLHPAVGNRNPLYATSVSVYGNVAVVGEPDEVSATGLTTGAVHVFRRGTNNAWTAERTIRLGVPPAASTTVRFGESVDVWGNYLVAGAPGEESSRGAIYVIDLSGSFDSQGRPTSPAPVKLVPPTRTAGQAVGARVAISGVRVIGGVGGLVPAAYTWARSGSWYHESTLPVGGSAPPRFGTAVDIDPTNQNLAVVGAPGVSSGLGQVYIYHRPVCCWPPTPAILSAPSGRTRFGSSVAASDDRVAIGGLFTSGTRAELRIATGYQSSWTSSAWVYSSGYLSTDPAYSFQYGTPHRQPWVSISGDVEMLGFPNAYPPGAPTTSREGTVNASDVSGLSQTNYTGSTSRSRGRALAMNERAALVGYDYNGYGAVYAYNIRLENGGVCSDGMNCLSGHCVDGRCCNTACGGGATNDCMACSTSAGGTTQGTCTALSAAVAPTKMCRSAAGVCDVAEYCVSTSTACPANVYKSSATVCDPATQPCEQDARCTGSSASCPANAAKPAGTACGTIAGPCDAQDYCNGSAFYCPSSVKSAGTPCGTISGACDAQDYCNGSSVTCPASYAPMGTVCGVANEPCEVAAVCTGASTSCPPNSPATAGTACGSAPSGPCDLQDLCNGSSFSCPPRFAPSGTVCLPANGVCDAPDVCTGSSTTCPPAYLSGNLCRGVANDCDVPDHCDGTSAGCPADETIPMCSTEVCGSTVDEDLDGDLDCFDDECVGHPTCGTTELSCSDGVDNDADGLLDCADETECPLGSTCTTSGDHICAAGLCVPRGCGDGYRDPGDPPDWDREGCDDGGTASGDACSPTCSPATVVVSSAPETEASPSRRAPSIAADGSGTLLFVFTRDSGSTRAVLARRFSPLGVSLDAMPIELASNVGIGWDAQVTVAGSASGWLVVWSDPSADGDGSGIATRRVSASGAPGALVVANMQTLGSQREGRVTALSSGFVVVWTDESGLEGPLGESLLQARRFSAAGLPVEDAWRVTGDGRVASEPALASTGDRWTVAWTDALPWTTGGASIAIRRFGAMLGDDAGPLLASAAGDGAQPALTALASGDFALAWVQRSTDPLGDIATRTLAASGDPFAGSTITVLTGRDAETNPYAQGAPAIVARTGSQYLVAYEDGGRRRDVRFVPVGGGSLASESSDLAALLLDGFQGDVSLLRSPQGIWFAWSGARDAAPADPTAYRSVLAYLLPHD